MNFFEQQDHARRQTRTLVTLFVLAVIAIVAAVNLVMALIWIWGLHGHAGSTIIFPKGFFATNTVVTLALIIGGTLIQSFNLRDGGDAVAQMSGGRIVAPATRDLQERRLLNVVEEMALASGIACPKVYLLEREDAINAFAAGYNPNEAVVAVTRGALNRLTRDELQGVVGHEFSHILNGDMRLNVHLIGVLFGIQMIAGFGLQLMNFSGRTWSGRRNDNKGPPAQLVLITMGMAFYAVGYIGIFFGRLIKSAVSRQREFLADASAVQFTRNPDGIGGALRKIGGLGSAKRLGSQIDHPNAEQLSHLFLSTARPGLLDGWFATHPPLKERLQRIYGRNMTPLAAPEISVPHAEPLERLPDLPFVASGFAAGGTEAGAPASITSATPTQEFGQSAIACNRLPPQLDEAVRNPVAANALVFALLLGDGEERKLQLAALSNEAPQQVALTTLLADSLRQLPGSARLPLVDLAMPALRQLTQAQRIKLLSTVDNLIAADKRFTLAEFVLQTVLARRLAPRAARMTPIRFDRLSLLKGDVALLLSLVAHVAVASSATQRTARIKAFMHGADICPQLGLSSSQFQDAATIKFPAVQRALDRANQLAPLAKPQLVKALLAATDTSALPDIASADILRAICAAIEAPIPPAVAATYHAYPWQFES